MAGSTPVAHAPGPPGRQDQGEGDTVSQYSSYVEEVMSTGYNMSAEDMENNIKYVQHSKHLHEGARELVDRAVAKARTLITDPDCQSQVGRGGRKAGGGETTSA